MFEIFRKVKAIINGIEYENEDEVNVKTKDGYIKVTSKISEIKGGGNVVINSKGSGNKINIG